MSQQKNKQLPLIIFGLACAALVGFLAGQHTTKGELPAAPPKESKTAEVTAESAQNPETEPTPDEPAASGTETKAATASATACTDYAKKICKEAGEQSNECGAITAAAELMPAAACELASADISQAVAKIADGKKSCTDLRDRLCKDLGQDTMACGLVTEQTPNFPPEQCKAMLDQYPSVLAELQRLEAQNKPLTPEMAAKIATGPSFGPADAKVTVVEFSDFLCPFCAFSSSNIEKARAEFGTSVRFVFRQFPLPMHGAEAQLAAEASLAANAQGKFWEMHDMLFQNQQRIKEGRPFIDEAAQKIGLDMNAFAAALDGKTFAATVQADIALATELGINGTPSLFINGARASVDPRNYDSLKAELDKAIAKAGSEPAPAPTGDAAAPAVDGPAPTAVEPAPTAVAPGQGGESAPAPTQP
ncbi:MAG: thioredoxin domain-containing protein [Myxococcota bacterium]|jgi:protein-disulfide isomerase|nr:thioredoxin domain-containing protein [Myxococcota bacterium]